MIQKGSFSDLPILRSQGNHMPPPLSLHCMAQKYHYEIYDIGPRDFIWTGPMRAPICDDSVSSLS